MARQHSHAARPMSRKLQEGLTAIADAISRKKGTFILAPSPPGESSPFMLAVGSWRVVRTKGGFIVTLGLKREQVLRLREMCDEILRDGLPGEP